MASYSAFLKAMRMSEQQVWEMTTNRTDQTTFDKHYPVKLAASVIHGVGLFSERVFNPGDYICPSRVLDKRTPAGRYMNHDENANTEMVWAADKKTIDVFASKSIKPGDELTTDYFKNANL